MCGCGFHSKPFLCSACSGLSIAYASPARHTRLGHQHGRSQCRHRRIGFAARKPSLPSIGRASAYSSPPGFAFFHRRDHGGFTGGAHCRRLALGCGRLGTRSLVAGGHRHHDHRHFAQGDQSANTHRRHNRHHHGYFQRCRHDSPQYGDHVGLYRHRCQGVSQLDGGSGTRFSPSFFQPNLYRWRHINQRFFCGDGFRQGRPPAYRRLDQHTRHGLETRPHRSGAVVGASDCARR